MRTPLALLLLGAALFSAKSARADALPEDGGCSNKRSGESCNAYIRDHAHPGQRGYIQAPGACAPFGSNGNPVTGLNCIAKAPAGVAGVTFADHDCEGRAPGAECHTITDAGKRGPSGACGPVKLGEMGLVFGCDTTKTPSAPASAAAAPVATNAPTAPAVRSCGCQSVGAVGLQGGLAAVGLLALGRWRRAGRGSRRGER